MEHTIPDRDSGAHKKNKKSETAEVAVEPCVSVITVLYPDTDTATRQPGYRGLIWRIITTPE